MGLQYQVNVSGTTYSGSTAFFSPSTSYFPLENFSFQGTFVAESAVGASNLTTTDANTFDAAFFVGNIADFQAGILRFATNSILQVYADGGTPNLAGIDVVEQSFNPASRIWSLTVADTNARLTQLNTFNTRTGLTFAPKQVLLGQVDLQFSPDFRQIEGFINLGGSDFIGSSTNVYQAEISGFLVNTYEGIAELAGDADELLGRLGFDALSYLASYDDLINAFGLNPTAALRHYYQNGLSEGRTITFQADDYIASYGDLISAFGYNLPLATQHFITAGVFEGRVRDQFNEVAYVNNYSDLQAAFGTNYDAATQHYITNGFAEGRVA